MSCSVIMESSPDCCSQALFFFFFFKASKLLLHKQSFCCKYTLNNLLQKSCFFYANVNYNYWSSFNGLWCVYCLCVLQHWFCKNHIVSLCKSIIKVINKWVKVITCLAFIGWGALSENPCFRQMLFFQCMSSQKLLCALFIRELQLCLS